MFIITFFYNILNELINIYDKIDKIIFDWWLNLNKEHVENAKCKKYWSNNAPIVFINENQKYRFFFNNSSGWISQFKIFNYKKHKSIELQIKSPCCSDNLYSLINERLEIHHYKWDSNNPINIVSTGTTTPLVNEMLINLYEKELNLDMFNTIVSLYGNHYGIEIFDYLIKYQSKDVSVFIKKVYKKIFGNSKRVDKFIRNNSSYYSVPRCNKLVKFFEKIDLDKNNRLLRRIYLSKNSVFSIRFGNTFTLFLPLELNWNVINIFYNILLCTIYSDTLKETGGYALGGGISVENQMLKDKNGYFIDINGPMCNLFEQLHTSLEIHKLVRNTNRILQKKMYSK